MRFYWVKTHWLVRKVFAKFVWKMPAREKIVYLTFDDGPTPEITPWVLDELDRFGAKATFFCIGKNIEDNPEIFQQTVNRGHAVGNHTFTHVNGWDVEDALYRVEVEKCETALGANNKLKLFRPPYGKVRQRQARTLISQGYSIIMWDILTADFDQKVSPGQCLANVVRNVVPGSIIIFHDSQRAEVNLRYALTGTLEFLKRNGYKMESIGQI